MSRTTASYNDHMNESPGPSALVSRNLTAIGSVAIDRFLSSISSADIFDRPYDADDKKLDSPPSPPRSPPHSPDTPQAPLPWEAKMSKSNINPNSSTRMQTVARLHQTCQRAFGSTEALKFEFLEEAGPNTKQCILTITRPNGPTRSYTTQPIFSRKNEAKAHAASIAINMGAIDFIVTGDSDPSKTKKGLVLAPLDSADRIADHATVESLSTNPPAEVDPSIKEIEDCCKHWRAGRVKPYWVALNEPKVENKHGTALRIELSPHSYRVYSSEIAHDTVFAAKQACAEIALQQGVLAFIQFGNGQTQPSVPHASNEETMAEAVEESVTSRVSVLSSANTLQSFYDSLPQPFPEDFGNKSASEINAPAWLNTTVQAARGGKLSTHFIWITDGTFGLHGCLLRIDRPGESKSYLVDATFPKRADAKAAVCLQAMSQGVGKYIRDIGAAADNKITPSMRKLASQILPLFASEFHKVRLGAHPVYDFNKDRDAYGCTMKVELPGLLSSEDIRREYTVPAEYRTKADAKIAVVLQSVEQGIIELLRFRGEAPPPGYVASYASRSKDVVNEPKTNKRKETDQDDVLDGNPRKKRRKGNKSANHQGDVPLSETRDQSLAPQRAHALPSRPFDPRDAHNKGTRKGLHASGSGGLGSISGPAHAGRLVDQYRSRSRDVGNFTTSHEGGPQPSYSSDTSSSHLPDERLAYGGGPVSPYGVAPHRPPSEPFQSGAYRSSSMHPDYGMHSDAAGGAVHHPPSHYPGPRHDLTRNAGYVPPYGAVPVPQNGYPSSHYAQPYQPAVPPSYHAQHPPAMYAARPPPIAPAGLAPPGYASAASYGQNYQTPAHQPSQQPPSQPKATINKFGRNAQALKDDRPSDKRPAKGGSSEQESGCTDGTRNPSKSNTNHHDQKELSSDRPNPYGQKLPAGPSSEPPLTGSSSKDRAPGSGPDTESSGKPTIAAVELPPKSHVRALLDYCDKDGSAKPQFRDEIVTADGGGTSYKVWVIMGMERLELPVTFPSLDEGRERVAKQVLSRLRSQGKKGKGKTQETQRQ